MREILLAYISGANTNQLKDLAKAIEARQTLLRKTEEARMKLLTGGFRQE